MIYLTQTRNQVAALVAAIPTAAAIATEVAAPSVAAIKTGVEEILAVQIQGPFGSLYTLVNPGDPYSLNPSFSGELTGAVSYTIGAAASGSWVMYGWSITSDIACKVRWSSNAGISLTDEHDLAAGVPWDMAKGASEVLRAQLEEALVLKISSASAKVHATTWRRFEVL